MYRPGGMSSEEDSDWDDDYYSQDFSSANKGPRTTPQISIEEQLLNAVTDKDLAKVEDLLLQGADINYYPADNWNAIIRASSQGNFDLVKLLVENGSDVNSSHEKFTPVLAVCSSTNRNENQLECCLNLLISKGANINSTDWYRISPLSHAVRNNHKKLVQLLINEKADVNGTDQDGWTPIFYAVDSNNADLVSLLKECGSNIYGIDRKGLTLVDIALEKENFVIAKLLSGCSFTDNWVLCKDTHYKNPNAFERILSECPVKGDRLSGFRCDMFTILNAVQLSHLNRYFTKKNIGLGHILCSDDNWLREIGISFWFERRKIIRTVEKFNEFPWGLSSFGSVPQSELDFFQVAQLMATVTRQMYLISVASFLWTKQGGITLEVKSVPDTLKENLKMVRAMHNKVKSLQSLVRKINEEHLTIPSDLILPQKDQNKFNVKVILIVSSLTGLLVYKSNLISNVHWLFHQR